MFNCPISSSEMGHPSGNRAIHIPKLLVYTLTILGIINEIISSFLIYIILKLIPSLEPQHEPSSHIQENHTNAPLGSPLSAVLIRELLPETTFSDVVCNNNGGGLVVECAVCLNEFESDEEIRCMKNCQHFFHKDCIDRWMDEDRNTCPLCRKSLVPMDSRKEYDHRLWQALCSHDYMYYEDDYLHTHRTTPISFD